MRLRIKVLLLAVVPLLIALALIGWTVWRQQQDLAAREHALVEQTLMQARRDELQHYVDVALSTVRPMVAAPGDLQARQAEAIRRLSALDYGHDGYFFVYALDGRVLAHARQPELVGQNLWGLRDAQGRPTIQQLIGRARAGGGFVDYLWRKPSTGQMTPKLGYVVLLPEWGWMLGTGLYLDDVQATVGSLDAQVRQHVRQTLATIAAIAVFGVGFISVTGLWLNLSEQRVADAKLRLLARQVVQSQEEERAHLARELHDGTSQTLVSGKLMLEAAVDQLERGGQPVPSTLPVALARLNDSLAEVRRISHRLRPAQLDTLGLAAAIEHLGDELQTAGGPLFRLDEQGAPQPASDDVKTALFRVAQEALANTLKHARAQQVRVSLHWQPGRVRLRLRDDGRGFDAQAVALDPTAGIGLRNMRERVATVGGTFGIGSVPEGGTVVEVDVPLLLPSPAQAPAAAPADGTILPR